MMMSCLSKLLQKNFFGWTRWTRMIFFDAQGALVELVDHDPFNVQLVAEPPLLLPVVKTVNLDVMEDDKVEESKIARMSSDMGMEFEVPLGGYLLKLKEKKARKMAEASKNKAPLVDAGSQKTPVKNAGKSKVKKCFEAFKVVGHTRCEGYYSWWLSSSA
ncbi:hypothetical protein AMTR_s00234p00017600 [Amborella trichopoda]|uniref:Uncharacterized protein n=1 Tax=Amborella trichopoda TaxID=13333 RepID=W1NT56_AMBTC|nr:hypothetical protein AMTR_s00234p00017600 [Amborella trichopoda]